MSFEYEIAEIDRRIRACASFEQLRELLPIATAAMGFDFFAVSRHPGVGDAGVGDQIHNYAPDWEARYNSERLARCDPVHRACYARTGAFRWRDARSIIPFTSRDDAMFREAQRYGIVDGLTIPANVYGAARGSVTFALQDGTPFPELRLVSAQGIGNTIFQTVLDLGWGRHLAARNILTERQLECVMWVGRGKSNLDIAAILAVSINTVKKHLRDACERYQLATRTLLPLRALYGGALSLADLFP